MERGATPLEPVRQAVSSVLKRRIPTEQRRAEILASALRLFGSKGFHDTTMEEVANAAGVAKGTIYLYFESKEHLLLALKKDFMAGLTTAITDIVAEGIEQLSAGKEVDYRDIIDDIFQAIVDYHCQRRDHLEIVVRQNPGPDLMQEALELEREFLQLLTNAFREGTSYELVHTDDPEMMARLVNAAIRDNLAACLCYGEPDDLPRLVEAAKQLLYKALAPQIEMPPRRPRLVRTKTE
ncbi:MAG: TetR/AcrR family transcriptional regulator [Candidatus Binatia bacterium]